MTLLFLYGLVVITSAKPYNADCTYDHIGNAQDEILDLSQLKGKIFQVNISSTMSIRYSVCSNGLKWHDPTNPKNTKDVRSILTMNGTDYYTSIWLNGEEEPIFSTDNGFNIELWQFYYGNGQEISNRNYLGQEIQWICDPNAAQDDIKLNGFVSTSNFYGLNITTKYACTFCKWYAGTDGQEILDLTALRNETLYFQNNTANYTYSICQNRFNASSGEEQMVYEQDDVKGYTQIWCKWQPLYIPIKNVDNGRVVWAFDYQHGQKCANATIEPNDCWLYWICDKTATKTEITSIVPGPFCDIRVNITSPHAC